MKVFITGGSGYLGRATVRALVAEGHDVLALARSEPAAHVIAELGATTVQGELRDLDVLRAAAAQADASIQLAQERSESGAQLDRAAAGAMFDGGGDKPYVHTGGTWMWGNTGGVVDESAPWAPPAWLAWLVENHRFVLEHAAHPVLDRKSVV